MTLDTRTKKLIDRGRKAVRRVLATGKDVRGVLEFEGIPVVLTYGIAGTPGERNDQGFGIAHIVAKRDWEHAKDPSLHPETGTEVALNMVNTLVLGRVGQRTLFGAHERIMVEWGGYRCVLERRVGNAFVITGYRIVPARKNPDGVEAICDAFVPTHLTPTLVAALDGSGVSGTRTNPAASFDEELEGDREAFQRVADLYAQALAADVLDLSFVPALNDALAALAADLGLDWMQPPVEVELVPIYHELGVPVYYEGPKFKVFDATGKGWVSDAAPFVVTEKGHGKVAWFSTVEEAVEDAVRREEEAKTVAKHAPPVAPIQQMVESDEQQLARLVAKRYKTNNEEKMIIALRRRIKADVRKWKVGDGVAYEVASGTRRKQINRGFRIRSIDAAAKTAVIVSVADTGLTSTGGDYDRIPPITIHVGDLVRDRRYDAPRVRERPPFDVPINGMRDVAIVEKMPLNVRGVEMWREAEHASRPRLVLFDPAGKESQPGYYALMEIGDVVASHHPDCSRNTAHRIAAAQPRDRSAKELCHQAETIARNLNPVAITGGTLAFDGSPVVTQEGYSIQGNGRAIALRVMYEKYADRAAAYRRYLRENATTWGLNPDDVGRFKKPVLVRVVPVTDSRAKHLGNIVNRSEAKLSRLDEAKSFVRRLSDQQRRQIGMTLAAAKADTLREMMDEVGLGLLDHLDGLDRTGMLRGGELTVEAKDLLRDVFVGLVFDTDDSSGIRAYQAFPHLTRSGIDKSLGYILPFVGTPYDLAPHLRGAALILHEMQAASGRFPNIAAYLDSSDAFTGPARDRFSSEAAILAHVLSTTATQAEIVRHFQRYEQLASGYTTLFESVPPATPFQAFAGAFNPGFRPNPEGCGCDENTVLAYFGKIVSVSVEMGKGKTRTFRDRIAFMTADGRTLIIVPQRRVKRVRAVPRDPAARAQFERFHHFNASGKGFFIDVPDTPSVAIGTARDIRYLSDKVMRPDDRKGKLNGYHHDFDKGQRPAMLHGDVLVIDRLEIDGRGILN